MKITVDGLLAIERAVLEWEGIALVVGHNEAGKTTIAESAAAALTGDPLMHGIRKKGSLGALVRSGHHKGKCSVQNGAGETSMTWPAGEHSSTGEAPVSSPIAAGRVRLMHLDPKERVTYLSHLLKAGPTAKDVIAYLTEQKFEMDEIHKVLAEMKKQGWEPAHAFFAKRRTEMSAEWRYIAGEQYGSSKAQGWHPTAEQGWNDGLEDATEEDFKTAIAAAKEELEKVIGGAAVSADRRRGLEQTAAMYDKQFKLIADTEQLIEDLRFELSEVESEAAALSPRPGKEPMRCPHAECKRPIRVRSAPGVLEVLAAPEPDTTLTPSETKVLNQQHAAMDGKLENVRGRITNSEGALSASRGYMLQIQKAKRDLHDMGEESHAAAPEVVEAARQVVKLAEMRRDAWTKWRNAGLKHEAMLRNEIVIEMLAPDGLRKRKLRQAIETFNATLATLSKDMGLPAAVMLDDDAEARMGTRAYVLLSKGAQYAVDAVLQLAVSTIEDAPLLIMDAAEVLIGDRRAGLIRMLSKAKRNALVVMGVKVSSDVPNLAHAKVGRTFWIEEGTAK